MSFYEVGSPAVVWERFGSCSQAVKTATKPMTELVLAATEIDVKAVTIQRRLAERTFCARKRRGN